MKIKVFSAAGGNPTAIFYDTSCSRADYQALNGLIQKAYPEVEQVGFFETNGDIPRLQMAGGEFCGNATRSFACLLSEMYPLKEELLFQVSGFSSLVQARVKALENDSFDCSAEFAGLSGVVTEKRLNGEVARVVDLGGIIHILIDEKVFPINEKTIKEDMKKIKNDLEVDCGAVGVIWVREDDKGVHIRPVVWVRDIDTCFDETSCGSGTIAVALAKGRDVSVIQPTGEKINVNFKNESLILSSVMKKMFTL